MMIILILLLVLQLCELYTILTTTLSRFADRPVSYRLNLRRRQSLDVGVAGDKYEARVTFKRAFENVQSGQVLYVHVFVTFNQQEAATAIVSPSSIQMTSLQPHERQISSSTVASSETILMPDDWFTSVAYNDLPAVSYYLSHGADVNMRCLVNCASMLTLHLHCEAKKNCTVLFLP